MYLSQQLSLTILQMLGVVLRMPGVAQTLSGPSPAGYWGGVFSRSLRTLPVRNLKWADFLCVP